MNKRKFYEESKFRVKLIMKNIKNAGIRMAFE